MYQQVFYYLLKATHQYKFNYIFSFLANLNDSVIEIVTNFKDKEVFEALLQTMSDTKLAQLYLSVLSKNTQHHAFEESILALPILNNNLIPKVISAVIQAKNDDLLLGIYNYDHFRDSLNKNTAFISKLISAIISKNNVHYIHALKNILTDAKNKRLTLSKENVCTLYLYCIDYNLTELKEEMINNESILILLLCDPRCNKPLFDKIIGSDQFFDSIKTREIKTAFQAYVESRSNSFSDENLPKAHQLILHPNTRELLPPPFAEAIVRRTMQLSKESPANQPLKTFIFDIIEYAYVSDLAILTLKSLMHYCLTHEKLDTLFCLDKHKNFSHAFDHDIYVETFQLALKLESNKHIENLAIHPFYYNLDFQDNFKLLCHFIKKNKGLHLFKKLFEDSFYTFFTPEHYQIVAEIMLACSESKLSEKNSLSDFAKSLLSSYKVHTQKLSKVIDLSALIQDTKIHSFYSLGKHLEMLTRKNDLIKLMQCYPTTQFQSIVGLHFQLNQEIVEEIEKDNVKILGNIESAQNQKLIHKSNRLFLKIEHAFQKQFNLYGDNFDARLMSIEKEIKTKLLDCIYLQAKEQEENKIDINRQKSIIEYIDKHKESLLSENQDSMTGFRKILIAIRNPMDDITHFQTAWLSYDKGFVRETIFEGNWDNYRKFFVAPSDTFSQGGAYSAGEHSEFFTNKTASQEVRKRACYYWLLVNDLNDPVMPKTINTEELRLAEMHKKDVLNFRIGNFFGIISSIYRTNGFGISTCYPGHLTAIMNMGLQHTLGTPVDCLEKIAHSSIPVVRNYIKELMNESTTWDGETKALKVDELLAFKPDHAKSLIIQSIQSNNKYNTFYQTVYMNIDKLRHLVWKNLPEDFIKDEDSRKINALIENAILGFASNPFIHDSIMEDILNSPCVMKDFNVEDDNMFLVNKKSIKYIYFTEFYNCIFKDILNSSSKFMPTIGQKSAINQLLAKIVTALTTVEDAICKNKIKNLLGKLAKIASAIPIDELHKLISEKQSLTLSISSSGSEQQNEPVLFAYQASLDEAQVIKENNEMNETLNKEPEKNNKDKMIFS